MPGDEENNMSRDNKFLTPPVWKIETTSYEDWKFDVDLWTKFTKTDKKKQGFAVYSVLPTAKGVNEKVRLAMQNEELKIDDENSVDQLFTVLDKWFKKDDLSVVCETWCAYKSLMKKESDSMDQFLNEYEKRVKELKKQGITLPEVVLAMQLIDGAGLDKKDKQIVLTAVDYTKKTEMYEQMKNALRKFFGEQGMSRRQGTDELSSKEAPVYTAESDEVYFASRGRYNNRGSRPRGYNRRGAWSGYGNGRGAGQPSYTQTETQPTRNTSFQRGRGRGGYRGRGRGGSTYVPRNPRDEDGNYLKCLVCESIMHFRRDCPHWKQNQQASAFEASTEPVNPEAKVEVSEAYKVSDYSQEDKQILMSETANAAILDSACSKTVAGRAWKEMYLASLSVDERKHVKFLPGGTTFKFGAGNKIQSEEGMEIPCVIGGLETTVRTDVVDSDIPLLLSKADMKRMGFKLNMENDTLEVNGRSIELESTSSGHYYIPLKECEVKIEKVHMVIEQKTKKEKEVMIRKLHRQFAHPSAKSLKAIMSNADALDDECARLIEDISKKCEVCMRFKKTPARPAVCLPLARQFNDVVAMDLKQYGDVYFIHFIDLFTRFSKSKVIRRKVPKVIVNSVATEWIAAGFGAPKKFLVDNGGEFNNEEYRELAEQFNVEVCATAAYSPWSNGICERNHYVVDVCVQKMLEEDPRMELDVALAWAVNAKNSMQNHLGYSPIQLVLGNHPNLPSVMVNQPPALEEAVVSDAVVKHLNALHAARRAFVKAESSDRIRKALRHKVRATETTFVSGDRVFYKRDDNNRWRGPGRVIGQDGKIVFVRHGSQLVRVATCRVIKTTPDDVKLEKQKTFADNNQKQYDVGEKKKGASEMFKEEDSDDEVGNFEHDPEEEHNAEGIEDDLPDEQSHLEDHVDIEPELGGVENLRQQEPEAPKSLSKRSQSKSTRSKIVPTISERIKYRLPESEEWTHAKIISKGGKSTGKNKYYVNVMHDKDQQKFGVHLDKVEYTVLKDDESREDDGGSKEDDNSSSEKADHGEETNVVFVPINSHGKPEVIKAKEQELQNWSNFDVYKEIQDNGQKALSTRWVVTEKPLPEGKMSVKARLVVRGFEEEEKVQSDSPTASKSTLRIVMAVAASEGWKCEIIDIKAAFLQGQQLERDIFLIPPEEVKEDGMIWKLNKAAYGLGDASRHWYFSVRDELCKLGCKQSELDKALFRWYNNGKLEGIFVMHVDDFLFAGTEDFNKSVIDPIASKYKVGKRMIDNFRYVGLNVAQDRKNVNVNQEEYAAEIKEIPISHSRKSDRTSSLNKHEIQGLRATAGQLNWLATQTRPDLSYDALELNMSRQHPTVEQILRANKAVRQAKRAKMGTCFPKLGSFSDWQMDVFCDASWGNLPDGVSSAQGHVIFLTGQEQRSCPLSWTSNKIKRKVSSTLAAETLAMHDALDEAIYLGSLISEIYCNSYAVNKIPITVYTDNRSLHQNIHSTKQVHEKRLRINIAEIQRMLASGEVHVIEWVPSNLQLADCLTKRGADPDSLLEAFATGQFKV